MYKEKKSIVHFEEVMMFPIKSHLPLITTHIEFQLKELPPPPQITPRRDLGAHLRHQARRNSVPYSRPRFTSEDGPVRNQSTRPHNAVTNNHSLN